MGDTAAHTTKDGSEEPLTPEQDAAVHAAVERGYYETPRRIETYELAEEFDVPGSTFSYRLRRAESKLATAYVEDRPPSSRLPATES